MSESDIRGAAFPHVARAHAGYGKLMLASARRRPSGYAGHASSFRLSAAAPRVARRAKRGGARRDRTADLVIANDALSQLSYGPSATVPGYGAVSSRRHLQSTPSV